LGMSPTHEPNKGKAQDKACHKSKHT